MQTTSSIWQPDAAICADGEHPADNISIHSAAVRRMLTDGQYDTAIDYLQTIADSCRQNSTFRRHARDIVTRIILVVTDVALQEELPVAELQDLYAHLRDTADSPDCLLAEELPTFVRRFQQFAAARSELLEQIKSYIAVHGNEYDFSLQKMAEHFDIPLRELGHLFQQSTGQRLIGYLWDSRLTKAQTLLAETLLPIRQIVQDVGYMDVSSFTRKFKAATGYTPGEYRLRHQPPTVADRTMNA